MPGRPSICTNGGFVTIRASPEVGRAVSGAGTNSIIGRPFSAVPDIPSVYPAGARSSSRTSAAVSTPAVSDVLGPERVDPPVRTVVWHPTAKTMDAIKMGTWTRTRVIVSPSCRSHRRFHTGDHATRFDRLGKHTQRPYLTVLVLQSSSRKRAPSWFEADRLFEAHVVKGPDAHDHAQSSMSTPTGERLSAWLSIPKVAPLTSIRTSVLWAQPGRANSTRHDASSA